MARRWWLVLLVALIASILITPTKAKDEKSKGDKSEKAKEDDKEKAEKAKDEKAEKVKAEKAKGEKAEKVKAEKAEKVKAEKAKGEKAEKVKAEKAKGEKAEKVKAEKAKVEANAGPDQEISLPPVEGDETPAVSTTLEAEEEDNVTYLWEQTSGPEDVDISDPEDPNTSVGDFTEPGIYVFELTATSPDGSQEDTDKVKIKVLEPKEAPISRPGPNDQTVFVGEELLISGLASTDDKNVVKYEWAAPPEVKIDDKKKPKTKVSSDKPGTYKIDLTVYDEDDLQDTESINVIFENPPSPKVNAGPDQLLDIPPNRDDVTTDLDASQSTVSGKPSYLWTLADYPEGADEPAIKDPEDASPEVGPFSDPGDYLFAVTVTDPYGQEDTDDVLISVKKLSPPVAVPKPDGGAAPVNEVIQLRGDDSTDDKGIVSYLWEPKKGLTLDDPSSPNPVASSDKPGDYGVSLTVTDADGLTDTKPIEITFENVDGPIAHAGQPTEVVLPENPEDDPATPTLDGSGSQATGTPTYLWDQIGGPDVPIDDPSSPTTEIGPITEPGKYVFELTVTDPYGNDDHDEVVVEVRKLEPPTAVADSDGEAYAGEEIQLEGTDSSDDVKVVSYAWTGPEGLTFDDPSDVNPKVTSDEPGTYEVTLTVTDTDGLQDDDTTEVVFVEQGDPVANAGVNQEKTLGEDDDKVKLTLDGSESNSEEGPLEFKWEQVSGPDAKIKDDEEEETDVEFTEPGTYDFKLTVTDVNGNTAEDDTQVTIRQLEGPKSVPSPETSELPVGEKLPLTGTDSTDDVAVVYYEWSAPDGVSLSDPFSATPLLTLDEPGDYTVSLLVRDGDDLEDTADIQVKVLAPEAPVAKAGDDVELVVSPDDSPTTVLDGTDSEKGPDSDVQWTQKDGPSDVAIDDPKALNPEIGPFDDPGEYTFELTITDPYGQESKDDVVVIIRELEPPVSKPEGPKKARVFDDVQLTGDKSTDDRQVVDYRWFAPPEIEFTQNTAQNPKITSSEAGEFEIELEVTDDDGLTDRKAITITIEPNQPPEAIVEKDDFTVEQDEPVNLDGTPSKDEDGEITDYLWDVVEGPSGTLSDPTSPTPSFVGDEPGFYKVELTVTDNDGATDTTELTVQVNEPPNEPPVAETTEDAVSVPQGEPVTLDGTPSSDPDGSIEKYSWSVDPEDGASFDDPSSPTPQFQADEPGDYTVRLTVEDDDGDTGTTDVLVTVEEPDNEPPVAAVSEDPVSGMSGMPVPLDAAPSSDPDGEVVEYLWELVNPAPGAMIDDPTSPQTMFTGMDPGLYPVQLTVTDNDGETDSYTMTVELAPSFQDDFVDDGYYTTTEYNENASTEAENLPPVASVEEDVFNVSPGETVNLVSTSNDPDGSIATYDWVEVNPNADDPIEFFDMAGKTISAVAPDTPGEYTVSLVVTDYFGADDELDQPIRIIVGPPTTTETTPAPEPGPPTTTETTPAPEPDVTTTLPPAPVVDAGEPITGEIKPDGSISLSLPSIPEGAEPFTTVWEQVDGPKEVPIDQREDSPTAGAEFDEPGEYTFKVTVTDPYGQTGTDTVVVTITELEPPVAKPTSDIPETFVNEFIVVDSTGSTDDKEIVSGRWEGPDNIYFAENAPVTEVTSSEPGTFEISLTVTDSDGLEDTATISLTFKERPPTEEPTPEPTNAPSPVADAGEDRVISVVPGTTSMPVELDGSETEGTGPLDIQWEQVSGPESAELNVDDQPVGGVDLKEPGTYVFKLTATDENGQTSEDEVQITVEELKPPVSRPGPDDAEGLAGDEIPLTGDESSDDKEVVSYLWEGDVFFDDPNSPQTKVFSSIPGEFEVSLTVTDSDGLSDTATITVVFKEPPTTTETTQAPTEPAAQATETAPAPTEAPAPDCDEAVEVYNEETGECEDRDECSDGTETGCVENAHCVNMEVSYNCQCDDGFLGDGFDKCEDINECDSEDNDCDPNARCENMEPFYNCFCNEGYSGNGFACVADDAPQDPDGAPQCDPPCNEEATCVDNNDCQCNPPLTGDGVVVCRDACLCRIRGDPIVETFDGNVIMVNGDKKYTLAKHMDADEECSFNVEAKAGAVGKVTYPRYVDIMIYGLKIRMNQDGTVSVGGAVIQIPSTNLDPKGRLSIYKKDNFIVLDSTCGIQLAFEGNGPNSVVTLNVPSIFALNYPGLYGLCGDCDGLTNDFVSADGKDLENNPDRNDIISQSYEVDETDDGIPV